MERKGRQATGLSLNELAELTGVSKQVWSFVENGQRRLPTKAAEILALLDAATEATMVSDQSAVVAKAEAELAEKKRKGGIISDREAFLEELSIEEMELKIKLREDKITALKAVAN